MPDYSNNNNINNSNNSNNRNNNLNNNLNSNTNENNIYNIKAASNKERTTSRPNTYNDMRSARQALEDDENNPYRSSYRRYSDLDEDDSLEETYNNSTSSPDEKEPSKRSQVLSEIFSYVKILVAAIIIAFVTTHFIIVNAQVPSGSMNNTIMEWDRLVGFRLSYLFSEPQRGDIVIFKYPDNENENYVKRVIGTPGDVVQIKDGHVYVNGELLEEDYIKEPMVSNGIEGTYVVPEGHYFMMGDNRNNSLDSRYWTNTYVAKDKILAKVIFRYYDGEQSRISFSLIN